MTVYLHEVVTATLCVNIGQVGVGGDGQVLVPHIGGELSVDVARLTELTVVAQRVEQLGQTLQLDELVAGLCGAEAPKNVDTGPVHNCGRGVPGERS